MHCPDREPKPDTDIDPAIEAARVGDEADERRYALWAALFDEDEASALVLEPGRTRSDRSRVARDHDRG